MTDTEKTLDKLLDESTTFVFIHQVPQEVKRRFKMHCARLGITMTDAIIRLMGEAIRKWDQEKGKL